ncbi:MAG: DNA polymerase III subunit gamma/tau [Microgenomates group bacterium]
MESTTFYLKYRPKKISELDLTEVRETLQKIAKSKKIPHALLFTGPKGTGKTSTARILAKLINCLQPKEDEPCNQCSACEEINSGASLDLIEIDAASNRGIDDIRDLKEKIKLSPVNLKYKVYIIDEVHMLTTEAFNALLKTLEEPPSHAVFILCTTEPEKIPETIVSRCLKINFRKAKPEEIINALKRAVKGEKIKVEKGVLEAIASSVDGSFRDAHKILEQLALEGKEITLKETKRVLEQTEDLSPEKLLTFIIEGETKKALQEIERVVSVGGDINHYLLRMLYLLRSGLLARVGIEEEEKEVLKRLNSSQIKSLINLFTEVAGEIRYSPIPQLPLEVAVVEWIEKEKNKQKEKKVNQLPEEDEKDSFKDSQNKDQRHPLRLIETKWSEILTKIKPKNHSVEALLKAARPHDYRNEYLILEVFYKFHKERLETEKCRRIVEETIEEVVGIPVRLRCILGEKKEMKKEIPQEEVNEEEVINLAQEIFGGKIV